MLEVFKHGEVTAVKGTVHLGGSSLDVFVYLVDGMLVDAGPQRLEKELADYYQTIDCDLAAFTHYHEDHTGMAFWLRKNKQIPLYIHPSSIETCARTGDYPLYRQMFWGTRKGFTALPVGDSIHSRRYSWQVIPTPGHSSDHLAYLNRETGVLFTGDLFIMPKTKITLQEESTPQVMDSIRTLLKHDFAEMFCSHAGYIPDGKKALAMKLDYLENMAGEIMRLHGEGLSVEEINDKLFPQKYPIVMLSDGEWGSIHIVRSVIESARL
ncbi:MBL fold metallo-hydrolase [Effusibacillus lacus]|uniref:MBL fold metallo-hydrolase n=1 Tax=Effusibacillus lacus TaxID=1348429 RepID=A0A292YSK4_9BACL|nr:MBL fold metallo-hydrolase [Effusibacillus lacus]TCS76367.1 metallo-beta-lactamase superfamily protein [Effusibacillus lacus]GAX91909.1 MBL fold metallo-hydrolase [Effusibacillus lacus]